MAKSLFGKNPDMEDVEFVQTIEASFGIRFDNKELEAWTTFGDVFDATCQHVGPIERGSIPCLSASAYRRIRRAILEASPNADCRPDASLATLISGHSARLWWRNLEQRSGVRLPALVLTNWSGLFLIVALFAVPVAVVVSNLPGWIALLSAVLGLASGKWLPYRPAVPTVGDLAQSVAALNAKQLSDSHGAIRTGEVWSFLVWIARDVAGFTDPIERDTALIG